MAPVKKMLKSEAPGTHRAGCLEGGGNNMNVTVSTHNVTGPLATILTRETIQKMS